MTSQSFFIIFIPILAFILLAVNIIFAPHNPYEEKDSMFECGFHSFLGQNRSEFAISFYTFGILFLLFDIEILLLYPLIVSFYINGLSGLFIMLIFFFILTLGFVYELGKGALSIESRQSIDIEDHGEQSNIPNKKNTTKLINRMNWVHKTNLNLTSKMNYILSTYIIFKSKITYMLFDTSTFYVFIQSKLSKYIDYIRSVLNSPESMSTIMSIIMLLIKRTFLIKIVKQFDLIPTIILLFLIYFAYRYLIELIKNIHNDNRGSIFKNISFVSGFVQVSTTSLLAYIDLSFLATFFFTTGIFVCCIPFPILHCDSSDSETEDFKGKEVVVIKNDKHSVRYLLNDNTPSPVPSQEVIAESSTSIRRALSPIPNEEVTAESSTSRKRALSPNEEVVAESSTGKRRALSPILSEEVTAESSTSRRRALSPINPENRTDEIRSNPTVPIPSLNDSMMNTGLRYNPGTKYEYTFRKNRIVRLDGSIMNNIEKLRQANLNLENEWGPYRGKFKSELLYEAQALVNRSREIITPLSTFGTLNFNDGACLDNVRNECNKLSQKISQYRAKTSNE